MSLVAAPGEAVDEAGTPRLGVYRGTLRSVGLERAVSWFQRTWRRKWWQYTAVVSEEVIAGAAVVDLGYVGLAFALAWDRREKIWYEKEVLVPLARGVKIEGEPGHSSFIYRGGAGHIELRNSPDERTIDVRMQTPAGLLAMDLEMAGAGEGTEPLTVIGALAPGRFNITHKEAGVALGGRITLGDRAVELDPETSYALFDWTQGVPPACVKWNWAMGAGRATDGRTVGFNLCVGYTDPLNSENAVWVDGRVRRVGAAQFEIPAGDAADRSPWRVRTADGAVDLSFQPEAVRSADTNLLVAVSRYRQPVGRFTGSVLGPAGEKLEVTAHGVAEDHEARW